MFRLNGDIIKQLENIYGIKFLPKYKNELKERILSFVHSIVKLHSEENIFETLHKISGFLIIEHNRPTIITNQFFVVYKQELFNSFNPIWYSSSKSERHLSKLDLDKISSNLIREILSSFLYLKDKNINPFSCFKPFPEHVFKFEISYTPKLYKKISTNLENDFQKKFKLFNENLIKIYHYNFNNIIPSFKDFEEYLQNKKQITNSDFAEFFSFFNIFISSEEMLSFVKTRYLYLFFLYKSVLFSKEKSNI